MLDPSNLLKRADELNQKAEQEADATMRARMQRMAEHYVQIAECEQWLAGHPTSMASVTSLLNK